MSETPVPLKNDLSYSYEELETLESCICFHEFSGGGGGYNNNNSNGKDCVAECNKCLELQILTKRLNLLNLIGDNQEKKAAAAAAAAAPIESTSAYSSSSSEEEK